MCVGVPRRKRKREAHSQERQRATILHAHVPVDRAQASREAQSRSGFVCGESLQTTEGLALPSSAQKGRIRPNIYAHSRYRNTPPPFPSSPQAEAHKKCKKKEAYDTSIARNVRQKMEHESQRIHTQQLANSDMHGACH